MVFNCRWLLYWSLWWQMVDRPVAMGSGRPQPEVITGSNSACRGGNLRTCWWWRKLSGSRRRAFSFCSFCNHRSKNLGVEGVRGGYGGLSVCFKDVLATQEGSAGFDSMFSQGGELLLLNELWIMLNSGKSTLRSCEEETLVGFLWGKLLTGFPDFQCVMSLSQPLIYDNVFFLISPHIHVCQSCTVSLATKLPEVYICYIFVPYLLSKCLF